MLKCSTDSLKAGNEVTNASFMTQMLDHQVAQWTDVLNLKSNLVKHLFPTFYDLSARQRVNCVIICYHKTFIVGSDSLSRNSMHQHVVWWMWKPPERFFSYGSWENC